MSRKFLFAISIIVFIAIFGAGYLLFLKQRSAMLAEEGFSVNPIPTLPSSQSSDMSTDIESGSLSLIYPKGGEIWSRGVKERISWSSNILSFWEKLPIAYRRGDVSITYNITLHPLDDKMTYFIGSSEGGSLFFDWKVGFAERCYGDSGCDMVSVPSGKYFIEVEFADGYGFFKKRLVARNPNPIIIK